MINNFYEINDVIGKKLESGESFSLIRLDNTMGYLIDSLSKNQLPVEEFFNPMSILEGGINPNTQQYMLEVVIPSTVQCIKNSDILGFVDISGSIRNNEFLLNVLGIDNKHMFFGDDFLVLDPGALWGCSKFGSIRNPWTKYLKGKRVLCVSTHINSILDQVDHLKNIWGDRYDDMAAFELVDCLRTPYHPLIDSRQFPGCNNFMDNVDYLKCRMDEYNYDVLLTSSSSISPFLAQYAKEQGKIGIQTGGTLPLLFGLIGGRWNCDNCYSEWKRMYNEYWKRPLDIDKAQYFSRVGSLETSWCYW